nr:alcohol dehydrogenase catalytic domain-containing protein [Marinobacter sp. X15-166B]
MSAINGNRGVVYTGPGTVEVQPISFPELSLGHRACHHGVILKVVATNICGSDQHMVRGRTTAEAGLVLGQVPFIPYRAVSGDEVPPPADAGNPV